MITLSGIIGSGKSSLTKILADQLKTTPFFEPVGNNPVLPLFYKGNEEVAKEKAKGNTDATNRYAFLLQIYFLNRRFDMIKKAMQEDNNILDRSIYEDALFMKVNTELGNANPTEYKIYKGLLKNMMEELPYAAHKKSPDLMIYINVNYDIMLSHIQKRGREYEQVNLDPSLVKYYHTLLNAYEKWVKQEYDASPLIEINANKHNFVENLDDRKIVLDQIYRELYKLNKVDDPKFKQLETNLDKLDLDLKRYTTH